MVVKKLNSNFGTQEFRNFGTLNPRPERKESLYKKPG
jgi:hypothetical protein